MGEGIEIPDEVVWEALAKGSEYTSDDDGFTAMEACIQVALDALGATVERETRYSLLVGKHEVDYSRLVTPWREC